MNLDAQSQQVYTSITELEKEKAVLLVKAKYYNNLKEYIQKNKDDINGVVVPSSMGIDDPVMTQILTQLQQLYSEKSERMLGSKAKQSNGYGYRPENCQYQKSPYRKYHQYCQNIRYQYQGY